NSNLPAPDTALALPVDLDSTDSSRRTQRLHSSYADHELCPPDVLLRGKYRLFDRPWAAVAAGLLLRLPSGNADDFQGTGTVETMPTAYVSFREISLASELQLRTHFNGRVDV